MTWMTRREAAAYLSISTRTLDRLKLPRSYVGRNPRYADHTLDGFLRQHQVAPETTKGRPRGRPRRRSANRPAPSVDWQEVIKKW